MTCLHYIQITTADVNSCSKDHVACTAYNIYYLALYRKLMAPEL